VLCHHAEEASVALQIFSFLQYDWRRDTVSLQKVINVNEARGINRMSPDPLS